MKSSISQAEQAASPQAEESADFLTVLEAKPGNILTKRFHADGTKEDFTAGYHMRIHELPADTWGEFLGALRRVAEEPSACIVRGAPVDDCPRAGDPGEWVYRRKDSRTCAELKRSDKAWVRDAHAPHAPGECEGEPANFRSVARRWVVYDFDDTATPFDTGNPEASIRAWHATLPIELRAARSAFFPSASAHVSKCVRGKLVVWYARPVSEARARAFAVHYGADPSVAGAVQPNFFAAPIFVDCEDTLAGRRAPIVFDGVDGVEVEDAQPPSRAALKATKARPAPVRLQDLPPGDAGIVAALGDPESFVGLRFMIIGQLGGIMRKLGYERDDCAAVAQEWLAALSGSEAARRTQWALGAWGKPAVEVSGVKGLAELVGEPHAQIIYQACLAARRPTRWVLTGGAK